MIPNIHPETNIAYGVTNLNSLKDWVYDEFFNHGKNTSYAAALDDWQKTNPDCDEQEFADEYMGEEDCYSLEKDGMSLELSYLGGAPMVFVLESSITTLCSQCSPCVPNAGDLNSQHELGMRAYTLPGDWFEDPLVGTTRVALEVMRQTAHPMSVGEWLEKKSVAAKALAERHDKIEAIYKAVEALHTLELSHLRTPGFVEPTASKNGHLVERAKKGALDLRVLCDHIFLSGKVAS